MWISIALCVVIGGIRLAGLHFVTAAENAIHTEDIFKDVAHLFVGWLIGMACGQKTLQPYGWMAIAMTVLEITAFLISVR